MNFLSLSVLMSFSDGSLSTKQIVFLQRPVLGRKRRESKVHDPPFLSVGQRHLLPPPVPELFLFHVERSSPAAG